LKAEHEVLLKKIIKLQTELAKRYMTNTFAAMPSPSASAH